MGEVTQPAAGAGDSRRRERIAFVTGKLAEFALRRALEEIAPAAGFDYSVAVLPIKVAALMTPPWVASHLKLEPRFDRVVLPGHCGGDLTGVAAAAGAPVVLGPKDLRELAAWFSLEPAGGPLEPPPGYGGHSIEIIAEINHAARLSEAELLAAAESYRRDGADVIDLGSSPGTVWESVGKAVRLLTERGFRVSIDTVEPREMALAARAGAELVLSVSGPTLGAARDLGCEVVVVPDRPSSLDGLAESVEKLARWKVPFRIDTVLEPIGFGFADSLGRYLEARRRFPQAEMMMGVGNLTELTDADSAGINVLLSGFCEELRIRSVLTTQVINWARSSVRELDLARRLVHHAVEKKVLPKHLEPRLLLLRDPAVREHGEEVLQRLAAELSDPSVRIFAERGLIHAISSEFHLKGADPFELFEKMGIQDASHAFYLGYEMQKAITALTLGKEYRQDQPLSFGFLTREEKSHQDSKRKKRKPGEPRG
jgi:dihydropteroate synthase